MNSTNSLPKSRSKTFRPRYAFLPLILWSLATIPASGQQQESSFSNPDVSPNQQWVSIPGPVKSFQRMSAISQKAGPEEVIPFLARNITIDGYHVGYGRKPKPTEYLKLLQAYLEQARDLLALAGADGTIRVSGCEEVGPLLRILGYKFRTPCGPEATLETADPKRAFLTIDSAFPLTQLEEDLQRGQPFVYAFSPTSVPILFSQKDWTDADKDFLGTLFEDPALARLYWAIWRLDAGTREVLRQSPGLPALVPYAALLDFYGSHLAIRDGRIIVPGGREAESKWRSLVGASPSSPDDFLLRLLEKDEGWLVAYFDALSFVPRERQSYFTEGDHLKRYYETLRGKDLDPSPARSIFRPTPNLYLLTSRLMLDEGGHPHVPGNLEVWKEVFRRKSNTKQVREWAKRSGQWKQPEHLLEAFFSLSRVPQMDGPLQVYLHLLEIDRRRAPENKLSPETVRLLAEKFTRFRDQFSYFTEHGELDDNSIARFFDLTEQIDRIKNKAVRANTVGLLQANLGIWQILVRQNQIPDRNGSWQRLLYPFHGIREANELFDAARASLESIWTAAGQALPVRESALLEMLAGPESTDPAHNQARSEVAARIRSAMESQRLVSLDTLFELGDGMQRTSPGTGVSESLLQLAGSLREFEMPLPIFTKRERSEWASGLHNNPHTSLQVRTDLAKEISNSSSSPQKMEEARGVLAPFFRDTLVGFNYAYFEPPGAQMLRNNPIFVRSHNFSGQMTMRGDEVWQTPRIFGRGWSASGGAHLAGSLADLPYVLAQMEQDFLIPENVQALIWSDLVPTIMTSAVLPRWWNVTPNEMQAVGLYQQLGEEIVRTAASDRALRAQVFDLLWDHMLPRRLGNLEQDLESKGPEAALSHLMPVELFMLGVRFWEQEGPETARFGTAGQEIAELASQTPEEITLERISEDFGVPHPMLAQTYSRELLAMKPLPTFLGYSSRLMAESWESGNLQWARLTAEKNLPPVALHTIVPELTRRMVQKIFATHLEDWPAVLRAMRETSDEFRAGKSLTMPQYETAKDFQETEVLSR